MALGSMPWKREAYYYSTGVLALSERFGPSGGHYFGKTALGYVLEAWFGRGSCSEAMGGVHTIPDIGFLKISLGRDVNWCQVDPEQHMRPSSGHLGRSCGRYPLPEGPRCFDVSFSETRTGSPKRPDMARCQMRLRMPSGHVS
jgi:hypothetical protein